LSANVLSVSSAFIAVVDTSLVGIVDLFMTVRYWSASFSFDLSQVRTHLLTLRAVAGFLTAGIAFDEGNRFT
jgi:hypothetical protein